LKNRERGKYVKLMGLLNILKKGGEEEGEGGDTELYGRKRGGKPLIMWERGVKGSQSAKKLCLWPANNSERE